MIIILFFLSWLKPQLCGKKQAGGAAQFFMFMVHRDLRGRRSDQIWTKRIKVQLSLACFLFVSAARCLT